MLSLIAKGQADAEVQSIVPQSPTVASLIQYADCPVSCYSGVPQINIPLYEINIDNFKIPISLSYNASGIKVAQEASWVGLGWSLNAGGCIARSMLCYDDFKEYQYPGITVEAGYYEDSDITYPISDDFFSFGISLGVEGKMLVKDSEPDIFYYSFLGYSGKFILDKSRGAVLFDKSSGLQITVNSNAYQEKSFTVTAPDGTAYIFNVKEHAYQHSRSGPLHRNNLNAIKWDEDEASFEGIPYQYTSSWFLSKIITPNKREIVFSYKAEKFQSPAQESCTKYNFLSHSGVESSCGKNTAYPYYSTSKYAHETYRLDRISWDNGYIIFTTSEREDMKQDQAAPQKLQSVKVYNRAGLLVKGYDFDYSYFVGVSTGEYDYVSKRLRLDEVTDCYDPNYKYTFSYFDGTFPAKNSKDTDYWGYCNGKNYGADYYCRAVYNGKTYAGVDKSSSLIHMQTGTLKSINYPTGGTEVFTYEMNTFLNSLTIGSNPSLGPPPTIQRSYDFYLYTKDRFDEYPGYPVDTSFVFTLSQETAVCVHGFMETLNTTPQFGYDYELDIISIYRLEPNGTTKKVFGQNCSALYRQEYMFLDKRTIVLAPGTYSFLAAPAPRDTASYWNLSYEDVLPSPSDPEVNIAEGGGLRIAKIEGGGKVRTFTYKYGSILVDIVTSYIENLICPGEQYGSFHYLVQTSESTRPLSSFRNGNYVGYAEVIETIQNARGEESATHYYYHNTPEEVGEHPFLYSFINFENGLPISIEYYEGSKMVKEENFEYKVTYSPYIMAFKLVLRDIGVYRYDYRVEWYSRNMHTTRIKGGVSSYKYFSVDEQKYTYNERLLPKSMKSEFYGEWVEQKTCYPTDYTDTVCQRMVAGNIVSTPIERLSLKDGQVVSAHKVSYKDTLGMFLPAAQYTLNAPQTLPEATYQSAYKAQVYYDLYNKNGKVLQQREKGMSTVYLWSYMGEYPIAEISNTTYATVASKLSALGITVDTLCDKAILTSDDIRILNTLRDVLPQSLVTVYTYIPLVGIESITSPDGQTIYYEYDANGRLKQCYYKEGIERRVLQHYNYNYTNIH